MRLQVTISEISKEGRMAIECLKALDRGQKGAYIASAICTYEDFYKDGPMGRSREKEKGSK